MSYTLNDTAQQLPLAHDPAALLLRPRSAAGLSHIRCFSKQRKEGLGPRLFQDGRG